MLGWAGAIFFAFCALPQVIKTLTEGHARNLSLLFLWMWFFGVVLCAGGAILDVGAVPWLLFDYSISLLCVSMLLRYKLFPRQQPFGRHSVPHERQQRHNKLKQAQVD
ncbi:MAG: PQ-loop domain-containing transporter [Thermoguttaceae bacterium]